MKEVTMRPGLCFPYRAEADVLDYPDGADGSERKRCTINVDFAKSDVEEQKSRGLCQEECLSEYRNRIESSLKQMIGPECVCTEGMEEMIDIIRESIKVYF